MTTPSWLNAVLRSTVWLGAAAWLAYLKKPDGGSVLAVRADTIGWLGGGLFMAGLAFHLWSNISLARGEVEPGAAPTPLVVEGPYQYVRNPIYLAGVPLLLARTCCTPNGAARTSWPQSSCWRSFTCELSVPRSLHCAGD